MKVITLRDASAIMIARFTYSAGMKIISQANGKWYTSKGDNQCFRIEESAVFSINPEAALYIWEGSIFVLEDIDE